MELAIVSYTNIVGAVWVSLALAFSTVAFYEIVLSTK